MRNLVKIDSVYLYTDGAADTASMACISMRQALGAIPYKELWYGDPTQHESVHAAINTWGFGPAGQRPQVANFPYIHWTEYYDDFTTQLGIATDMASLVASPLMQASALVKA